MSDLVTAPICLRPFYALELHIKGDVYTCCPAWVKRKVGNLKHKSLQDIWNDTPLQLMRKQMLEGNWSAICHSHCPIIARYLMSSQRVPLDQINEHPVTSNVRAAINFRQTSLSYTPTWINLANSNICNLNCVMCGREHYREDATLTTRTADEVKSALPGLQELFLTGNGDPFARPDTRELLLNLDSARYPNLKIDLLTNGLLLPRYWNRVQYLKYGYLNISVDAATRQTYENIRRGGTWRQLLAAFDVVQENRNCFSHVSINMTVMRDNYLELKDFVELAARYGFGVGISPIRGKWGEQNIFTLSDPDIISELRKCIVAARERADELGVGFECSGFTDLLAGNAKSVYQRYRQLFMDNMVQLYYRMKR